jgi:L-amino acid N-acyltransferase YncA
VIIRDAVDADVPAITDINNEWIPSRTITWTEELETYEQRAAWLERQRRHGLPVLVADDEGEVVGFITYEHFRGDGKRPGYRGTAELSIHVREDHWGRGIGRTLIEALIEYGRTAGIHVLVASIDAENEASLRFHARLGFVEVGRLPETGQKFGRWLDLVLMQRILDSRERP